MRPPSLIPLSHDHHHGLALALRCRKQALGQLRPMGALGLEERAKEVKDFFSKNLESHFRAEEEVVFPLLRSSASESRPLIEDLVQEHGEIRRLVARLQDAPGLSKVLFDLGDILERHIRREERELFPLFESHVPAIQAEEVKERIEKILLARDA